MSTLFRRVFRAVTLTIAIPLFVAAICSESAVAADGWKRDFYALKDDGFVGALSDDDVALAKSIANTISATLTEDIPACGASDPMKGVSLGNLFDKDAKSLEQLAKHLDARIKPLFVHVGVNHHQTSVALYVLSRIGPKAHSAKPLLSELFRRKYPWSGTALGAVSCENYVATNFFDVMNVFHADLGFVYQNCRSSDLEKMLTLGLDERRHWPPGIVEETIGGGSSNCAGIRNAPLLSDETWVSVRRFLESQNVEPERKAEILQVIEAHWLSETPRISMALGRLLQSDDDSLRDVVERLLVTLGDERSAAVFISWLRKGYSTWFWPDYTHYLRKQKATVLPALVEHLKSPWWDQRTAAVEGIGELGAEGYVDELVTVIRPDDWMTTLAAVKVLHTLEAKNLSAKMHLRDVAMTYWSPMVREAAGKSPQDSDKPDGDGGENAERMEIIGGIPDVDHGLQTCPIRETKKWIFPDGSRRRIVWIDRKREPLPRGRFEDVSGWCSSVGRFVTLDLGDGWIAGCQGFEGDGGLAWLPKDPKKSISAIAHLPTIGILKFNDEIYVAGIDVFSAYHRNAGQLYQLRRLGDEWRLKPAMLLPSLTDAVSVVGEYMVFDDAHSTVAVDKDFHIHPLRCKD